MKIYKERASCWCKLIVVQIYVYENSLKEYHILFNIFM